MFAASTGNFLTMIWIVIAAILIIWGGSWLYRYYMTKRLKSVGGEIDPEQFETTMRKAQVIDLRESTEFDKGHILGARNVPYTQFKERVGGLRKDMPLYIYDATGALSLRAASKLKKLGYDKIYWLKNGFENWSGKTKAHR